MQYKDAVIIVIMDEHDVKITPTELNDLQLSTDAC